MDGISYSWLGQDPAQSGHNISNVTNVQITPTRSVFVLTAGPMNVTVTFLSPIEVSVQLQPLYLDFDDTNGDGVR